MSLGLVACNGDANGPGGRTAAKLAFTTQPGTGATGQALPAFAVSIQDTSGALVSDGEYSVTVALEDNPSSAVLSGTTSLGSSGGVATFSDLHIGAAGTGYTLRASATGLADAISAPFDVSSNEPPGALVGRIVFGSTRSGKPQLFAVMP